MKITENIHYLEQPLQEIFTACYLIVGKEITVIDSGFPETWEKVILPYFKSIRRKSEDISFILNTHNHGDHMGSDKIIKELTGAKIGVHETGVEGLEKPEVARAKYLAEYGKYMTKEDREKWLQRPLTPPIKVDHHLRDNEVLDVGGMKIKVIHTPGHSPDSVCFYDSESGTLFTGDSILGQGTKIDDFLILHDVDAYLDSIARLMKMDLRLMLMAHAYRPPENAILRGRQVKSYLKYSAEINNKIADQIVATIRSAKKPMSTAEISYAVCPIFCRKIPEKVTTRGIIAHLQRLAKQGKVVETKGPECIFWSLKN